MTFSCSISSGPRDDLCEINDGTTLATFEETNGYYYLESDDITGVPQGAYAFDIVA